MNVSFALASLALAGSLQAATAPPPAPPGGFPVLTLLRELRQGLQSLDLDAAQKAGAREVARGHREAVRSAADRAHAARLAVLDAIARDEVDEALIRQRVQDASASAADLAVARARLRHDLRGVLSAEQRSAADALRERLRAGFEGLRSAWRAFLDEAV
jgi:Spy/CpxP family protein refolding chaperone